MDGKSGDRPFARGPIPDYPVQDTAVIPAYGVMCLAIEYLQHIRSHFLVIDPDILGPSLPLTFVDAFSLVHLHYPHCLANMFPLSPLKPTETKPVSTANPLGAGVERLLTVKGQRPRGILTLRVTEEPMPFKIIAQVLFLVLFIGAMTTLAYLTNRLGIEFALGGLTGIAIMQFGYWGKYGKFIDF